MPQRPPCFTAGYFYLVNGDVVLNFSDDTIYEYPSAGIISFLDIKDAAHHGTAFNFSLRRDGSPYSKLNAVPAGWSDQF